jgi:hypothetical protein
MTQIRIWTLLAAVVMAAAPAVRAGDPPVGKPCCCHDEKPAAISAPATATVMPAEGKCCCGDAKACCCETGSCCAVKDGCECKDCCCAKGCKCAKARAACKGGVCGAAGCCVTAPLAGCPAALPCPVRPFMPLPPMPVFHLPLPPPLPAPPGPFAGGMMPPPCPVPPPMVATPVRVREVQRSTTAKWCVATTAEEGQSCLEICQGDDCKVTCDKFILTVADQSFKVAVQDNQVRLEGPYLKAAADKITRSRHHTDRVVLEGHVKLSYNKDGQKAELTADTVVVDLGDGSIHMKPAVSDEAKQMFHFFLGIFSN